MVCMETGAGDVDVAGSDRRNKTEVGRTGARFGYVSPDREHAEEEWGEPAVSTARRYLPGRTSPGAVNVVSAVVSAGDLTVR